MKSLSFSKVGHLPWSWTWVSTKIAFAAVTLLIFQSNAFASDPTGVFALIDKVVLEPNDTAPERIQVWGAFAVAEQKDRDPNRDAYKAAEKGYLYFSLPSEKADI